MSGRRAVSQFLSSRQLLTAGHRTPAAARTAVDNGSAAAVGQRTKCLGTHQRQISTEVSGERAVTSSIVSYLSRRFWEEVGNSSRPPPWPPRIPLSAVQDIWVEAALREAGARENAGVVVGKEVREAMEKTIREALDVHQDGKVEYEEFLGAMVQLVVPNISRNDLVEVANELFEVYFPDDCQPPIFVSKRTSYEDRRPSVVQELKIKTAYQLTQGQNNMDIIKNIENTESSNFFTAREFLIKMKNIPHFKGMGFC